MDNTQLIGLLAVAIAVALGAAWWWYISRKDEAAAPTYTKQAATTRAVAAEPPLLSVPSFVRAESLGEPEGQTAKALFNTHVEREELGGGRFRDTIHIKKIAHRRNGTLRRIRTDWEQGDANFPHVALDADTLCYVAADGMRRLCPTADPQRYFEIGAPFVYTGNKWNKIGMRQAKRDKKRVSWQSANADLNIIHGGHFIKLEIPLKGGWQPPTGRVAFPVGLNGLTRSGGNLLADGKVVMSMQAPNVYDAANPMDVRDVGVTFPLVGGQRYALLTLPDLTGMASPVIDPTFTDQPGADDGRDCHTTAGQPNTNYNGGNFLFYDKSRRCFAAFNLATIPAGATVTAATLTLTELAGYFGGTPTLNMWRVLDTNDWVEAEATWNIRKTGTAWAGSAGCSTANVDFDSTACIATPVAFTGSTGARDFVFNAAGIADVQLQLTTNQGFVFANVTGGVHYCQAAQSENATTGYRPKLVVEYTVPGGNPFIVRAPIPSWCH